MNKTHVIIASIILLIATALLILGLNNSSLEKKADSLYLQGLEFYKKGDFQNAYYNFGQVPFSSSYSGVARYKQAVCAEDLADNKTAIKKYSSFLNNNSGKYTSPAVLWRLGLLNLKLGHNDTARRIFSRIEKKYKDTDFAYAASYQLALLSQDEDPELAKEYLIEYLEYAPMGKYFESAIAAVEKNKTILNDKDKYFVAVSLYKNGFYQKSVSYLKEISLSDSWVYLAKNYQKLGQNSQAASTILKGVSLEGKCDEKDVLELVTEYAKLSPAASKSDYLALANASKSTKNYPATLFMFSKYVDKISAIKNYNYIYAKHPDSILAPDCAWQIFWNFYQNGQYKRAISLFRDYSSSYDDVDISPKITYWAGKIYEQSRHKKQANILYKAIILKYPTSYYAFRAARQLEGAKHPWKTDSVVMLKEFDGKIEFPLDKSDNDYAIFHKFAQLGDYKALESFKIQDEFVKSWMMYKDGDKLYSMFVAKEAIAKSGISNYTSPQFKLAYPMYYVNLVNKYSKEYGVSPHLIMALMREESHFNPNASSFVGARGLMQLMPETARSIAGSDFYSDRLFNPEYNISLGVKYFAHLVELFDGNEMLAVLSYNGGPNAVKGWINSYQVNSSDELVELIPYPETQSYLRKVFSSYWNYLKIYN